jgi:hypothetical protein
MNSTQAPSLGVVVSRNLVGGTNNVLDGARLSQQNNTSIPLNMKQAIFGQRIPRKFKPVSRLWLLMRGIIGRVSNTGCKKDCLSLLSAPLSIH